VVEPELVLPRLLRGLVHAVLASGALAAIALAAGRRPRWRPWAVPAIAALLWVAAVAAAPAGFLAPAIRADQVAGLRLDAPPPGPRITNLFLTGGKFETDAPDVEGRHVELLARRGSPPFNVAQRLDSVDGYGAMYPIRTRWLGQFIERHGWRLLRRYAVSHVVADAPRTPEGARTLAEAVSGGTRVDGPAEVAVFSVPHRSWASFAPAVVAVATQRDAALKVVELFERGAQDAVLEAPGESFAAAPGRVLSLERGTEHLRVEAQAEGEGVLVVNDTFWPGWKATVDGRPVRIYAADALVRAVRFPPGRHVLRMDYEPPEVTVGLWLSGLGLAAVVALALVPRPGRRAGEAAFAEDQGSAVA
jgi:hypothetical protein